MTIASRLLDAAMDRLGRRQKQAIAAVIDAIVLPLALWSAIALRLGEWSPDVQRFWSAFIASVVVGLPAFYAIGLYRHIIRYVGTQFGWAVLKGVTVAAAGVAAVDYLYHVPGFPRSAPMIFWVLSMVYVFGTRYLVRVYAETVARMPESAETAAVYGAGAAGVELVRRLRAGHGEAGASADVARPFPLAFVDASAALQGRVIDGLPVVAPDAIGELVTERHIRQMLVALPGVSHAERRRVIASLEPYPLHVRLLPDVQAVVSGEEAPTLRDVDVVDLIERDPVTPMPKLLAGCVTDRAVLVTGAGGSIGSELCRQILALSPRLLVLLDQSELGLFDIHRELVAHADTAELGVPVAAVLGSAGDAALFERVLGDYGVQTVYHAAAYKHVGLVEHNAIAGVSNNAFGTRRAAQAAALAGVSDFILISTDKAVRTRSVMGASKRLAEMILQALQASQPRKKGAGTRFSIVRFGNVLCSSGSVVPLFHEQIMAGGPVTVTHPEATRYFMTIPEAAELVLQASSMANGGDIFLLDMGEPVNIRELAARMIRLHGYTVRDEAHPGGDLEIRTTGLTPGEKMREELLVGNEAAEPTEHPKILRAFEIFPAWSELAPALDRLQAACDAFDVEEVRAFLGNVVEDANLGHERGADVIRLRR